MSDAAFPHRESAKKRIMFVAGEDSYFLVYTALLLLADLRCFSPEKGLADSMKIAYLADFISNASDLRLALLTGKISDPTARARLALLYDRAAARRAPLERVLEAISRRGLVSVERTSGGVDRMYLLPNTVSELLVANRLYDGERAHIGALRRLLPRIRTMKLSTLKDRLFGRHGVRTWGA